MGEGEGVDRFQEVAFQPEHCDRGREDEGGECGEEYCSHPGEAREPEGDQAADREQDDELREGPLFIEGVDHLNVEGRRYVDAANDVVKEDVGVLEEPGQEDDGEGYAHQAGVGCQCQQGREDENQDRGCAAGGAEEVGE